MESNNSIFFSFLKRNSDQLLEKIEAKQNELYEMQSEYQAIQEQLLRLGYSNFEPENININKSKSDQYSIGMSMKQKIAFTLKVKNRFLHIREIADFIMKKENVNGELSEYITKVRQKLIPLKSDGVIISYKAGTALRNTVWGSPKWIDSNGKIIAGHEFDPNILSVKDEIEI